MIVLKVIAIYVCVILAIDFKVTYMTTKQKKDRNTSISFIILAILSFISIFI